MSAVPHQLPFDFSLEHEFTLENFVPSARNRELLAALTTGAAEQFIYLWGGSGSGKSHLLQACCHRATNAAYLPLSVYGTYGPEILEGLEELDLLCVDDIDSAMGDRHWEEALLAFFNLVRERGTRLMISAKDSPRNLLCNLPDLDSRLSWGVVYQLEEVDDESKASALVLRAENAGIPLRDEVVNYILLRSARDMKGLFGVLKKLDQLSLAEKRRITIPFVKEIMGW